MNNQERVQCFPFEQLSRQIPISSGVAALWVLMPPAAERRIHFLSPACQFSTTVNGALAFDAESAGIRNRFPSELTSQ